MTLSFRPHIKVHSSDKVVPVLSVTFTSFWIIAAVGSVDETSDDSGEVAVEGVAIVVVVVVDVVVIGNSVARGLSQITLRLPLDRSLGASSETHGWSQDPPWVSDD